MDMQRNIKARSYNHYGRGKAKSITVPECFCSLRYPACSALYNTFPQHRTNGTIILKKVIEHKMCVLIICKTFVSNTPHFKEKLLRHKRNCTSVLM